MHWKFKPKDQDQLRGKEKHPKVPTQPKGPNIFIEQEHSSEKDKKENRVQESTEKKDGNSKEKTIDTIQQVAKTNKDKKIPKTRNTKTTIATSSLEKEEFSRDRKLRDLFNSIKKFHEKGDYEKCRKKAEIITNEIENSKQKDFFKEKFGNRLELFKEYFEQ